MRLSVAVIVVSGLALSTAASAQILYSQPSHTPGATGGNGLSTATYLDREIADDFVVPSPGWLVTGASINGVYFDAAHTATPANLTVRFYADSAGQPGSQIGGDIVVTSVGNVETGVTYFSRPERTFSVSFPAVTLNAGSYFVSIQPDTANENWFTLTSSPTTPIQGSSVWGRGGSYGANWDQSPWADPHDLAFALSGTVIPSPGALSLLALGGLAALRRRRA